MACSAKHNNNCLNLYIISKCYCYITIEIYDSALGRTYILYLAGGTSGRHCEVLCVCDIGITYGHSQLLTRCMDCPNMAWVGMAVWTNNIHLWSLFGRTLKGSPCFDVFDICCFVCYAPCFIEKSHADIGVLHTIWRHRPSLMAKISMAWVRDRVFQIMSDTIRYKISKTAFQSFDQGMWQTYVHHVFCSPAKCNEQRKAMLAKSALQKIQSRCFKVSFLLVFDSESIQTQWKCVCCYSQHILAYSSCWACL